MVTIAQTHLYFTYNSLTKFLYDCRVLDPDNVGSVSQILCKWNEQGWQLDLQNVYLYKTWWNSLSLYFVGSSAIVSSLLSLNFILSARTKVLCFLFFLILNTHWSQSKLHTTIVVFDWIHKLHCCIGVVFCMCLET